MVPSTTITTTTTTITITNTMVRVRVRVRVRVINIYEKVRASEVKVTRLVSIEGFSRKATCTVLLNKYIIMKNLLNNNHAAPKTVRLDSFWGNFYTHRELLEQK